MSDCTPFPSFARINKNLSVSLDSMFKKIEVENRRPLHSDYSSAGNIPKSENSTPALTNPSDDAKSGQTTRLQSKIKEDGGKKNTSISGKMSKAHCSDTTQTKDWNKLPKNKREAKELLTLKSSLIIFAIVVLILAMIFIVWNPSSNSLLNDQTKMFEKVDESVTKLKQNFKNQEPETWKKLKSAVKALFRNTTKQPSVVIFFADEGAENVSSCLARKLAHETESLYGNGKNFIHENGKLVKDQNEHKYKEHIDTIANKKFGTGSHVFLLENLNLIPGKSVMMFHGLCDDQHPHFIHVLYLMTVNIVDLDFIKMGENIDVDDIDVTKVWEKIIHTDQRGSLESRIGGCKVLVKREENLICDL